MANSLRTQLLIITLAALLTVAVAATSIYADGDQEGPASLPEKTEQVYPALGSKLNRLVASVEQEQVQPEEETKGEAAYDGEPVAVSITLSDNAEGVAAFLEENGVVPANAEVNHIEAYVPVTLLGPLSEQPGVVRIRQITPPPPTRGNFTTEGVAAHLANAWHDKGFKGQGVKVGIIDAGFEQFSDLMGTELPANVKARCYESISKFSSNLADCGANSSHGTGATENIMDMAPEVSLYIQTIARPETVWTPWNG